MFNGEEEMENGRWKVEDGEKRMRTGTNKISTVLSRNEKKVRLSKIRRNSRS